MAMADSLTSISRRSPGVMGEKEGREIWENRTKVNLRKCVKVKQFFFLVFFCCRFVCRMLT